MKGNLMKRIHPITRYLAIRGVEKFLVQPVYVDTSIDGVLSEIKKKQAK